MIRLVPHVLDLGSRKFWRLTGRQVDLDGRERWLDAPSAGSPRVSDEWLAAEAARHGGVLGGDEPSAGLLPSMALLDGPGFDSERLRPEIRDFYEHTAAWQMEVWTGWSPLFWPGGELVVPALRPAGRAARPADAAPRGRPRHGQPGHPDPRPARRPGRGRVDAHPARQRAAVFSGAYSARTLPGADRPSVHVAFPLESGNVQVFLRPIGHRRRRARPRVTDRPVRPGRRVRRRPRRVATTPRACRCTRPSTCTSTRHGVLRTDHELRLWTASAVRLHYKLERVVVTVHTFHLAEVPALGWARGRCCARRPATTAPGLDHAECLSLMRLGAPTVSPDRLQLRRLAVFAQWRDEAAVERFLAGRPARPSARRRLARAARVPASVVDLAALPGPARRAPARGSRTSRSSPSRWPGCAWGRCRGSCASGKPVERLVRDHPGVTLALAALRPPHTDLDLLGLAHGARDGGDGARALRRPGPAAARRRDGRARPPRLPPRVRDVSASGRSRSTARGRAGPASCRPSDTYSLTPHIARRQTGDAHVERGNALGRLLEHLLQRRTPGRLQPLHLGQRRVAHVLPLRR